MSLPFIERLATLFFVRHSKWPNLGLEDLDVNQRIVPCFISFMSEGMSSLLERLNLVSTGYVSFRPSIRIWKWKSLWTSRPCVTSDHSRLLPSIFVGWSMRYSFLMGYEERPDSTLVVESASRYSHNITQWTGPCLNFDAINRNDREVGTHAPRFDVLPVQVSL